MQALRQGVFTDFGGLGVHLSSRECARVNTRVCDACGSTESARQQSGNFIDDGWSFNWVDLGHYGGFTDPFLDSPADSQAQMIHICHDCCVKLLAFFPALAEKTRARGGHPNRNEHDPDNGIATPPCCPYAWTWVRNKSIAEYSKQFTTYMATDELTWLAVPDRDDETHVEWAYRDFSS